MTTLYHYTCSHSRPGIWASGVLRPNRHPYLPDHPGLVWLTDLDAPDRLALGLTSYTLRCDRTEHRVSVEIGTAERWPRFARRFTREVRESFENVPGAMPAHWWVAERPVPIIAIDAVVRVRL